MPHLYIISGCNGAGKTTASYTILPEILNCKEFVNADEIAKGLSPFQPETVSILAGRIMLERINEMLAQGVDFAIETTLTTLSYQQTIEHAKRKGYTITLLFFWLNHVNLAIERVKTRVAEGGHHIPEDVIVRRYYKGISNLIQVFTSLCDYWIIIDNSVEPNYTIATGNNDVNIKVKNKDTWMKILDLANGK
ncbi:zeta toxin family protein [uncultured Mucilaginibacter sp.]|uniref:zeta toxin family protein n=1 Tax=uncultured Mucilaginibacter sp. TaxID=797541 RepID=UPI00261FD08C|nr:zeta toxin family protein [uncultured Mucilaginibacter sp.]